MRKNMKHAFGLCILLFAVSVAFTAAQAPATTRATVPSANGEAQLATVKQYCAGCHSERGKAGNLSLAAFDAAKIERSEERRVGKECA